MEQSNKTIVFGALFLDDSFSTSVNLKKSNRLFETYLKCAFVSLFSAKEKNPNCNVALVTNIDKDSNELILFKKVNIEIVNLKFDSFLFDRQYKWAAAFYKLCVLKHILNNFDYENIVLIDLDTVSIDNYDSILLETKSNILAYDINEGLNNPNYCKFINEANSFGVDGYITHYGGEFLAGNKRLMQKFIDKAFSIYKKMINDNFVTTFGDEFISCIALDEMKEHVKNASPYIYRFWTGTNYLSTTQLTFDPFIILHVPAEKENGLIKIFKYIIKHRKMPSFNRGVRLLKLDCRPYRVRFLLLIKRIIKH